VLLTFPAFAIAQEQATDQQPEDEMISQAIVYKTPDRP
jgi:hypothetical protein